MPKPKYIALSSLCLFSFLTAGEVQDSNSQMESKPLDEMVNAPSRFEVRDGYNMFFNTEFLYWLAQEDGLYFAQSGSSDALPATYNGYLKKVKPQWDPGFRFTFGGNMPYDGWDILASWTYYHSKAKGHSNSNSLYLWGFQNSNSVIASQASATWHLTTNLFDAEIGRSSWIGTYFSLRPFMGVRGAWISQQLYTDAISSGTPMNSKAKSNFTGAGGRAGVEFRLHFKQGWSLIAQGSGSLLYGSFDTGYHEKENGEQLAASINKFRSGLSTAQLILGTQWDTFFDGGKWHFGGRVAWEQNMWFGVNKMLHWKSSFGSGVLEPGNYDLSLQGLTVSARFDF